MSRRISPNIIPITLVTVCGIATAYVTFQPLLAEQQEERTTPSSDQAFAKDHASSSAQAILPSEAAVKGQETAISRAILSDFKEAGQQVKNSGVGWGFRNLWEGKRWDEGSGVGRDIQTLEKEVVPEEKRGLNKGL